MSSRNGGPERQAGGFFGVESVDRFVADHPDIKLVSEIIDVPGGKAATFLDPAGNVVRLFDQSTPAPE